MKKIVILSLLATATIWCSCQEALNSKRTKFFNQYLKEQFRDFEIKDGEYLFILPGGCINCNKALLNILYQMITISPDSNYINSNYNAILVSQNALGIFSEEIMNPHKTVLVDKTNKLDRMSFGISGISVLKIKDKKVVTSKSFTINDYRTGSEKFFKERL
ncbi:MAG: hypothetical protein LBU51_05495 [Bacteroidales bacterium]|jgi:AAA+ superfamily predicted ATPase|nr:hypothetical protein [Bacteroidales bacterium]